MGYAGRMLAQHNPWFYFGLWVFMVALLNISVVCSVLQEHVSLWIGVLSIFVIAVCSIIILAPFWIGAKQQHYLNIFKSELILSRVEEKIPYSDGLFIAIVIAFAILFTLGILYYSFL